MSTKEPIPINITDLLQGELKKMRILFPSTDDEATFESPMEKVLGNARSFMIYDSQLETQEVITNKYLMTDDIKCKLAGFIIENNVDTVVCCEICPNCYDVMDKSPLTIWVCDGAVNIKESYHKLIMGGLMERSKPDVCDCVHHQDEKKKIELKL